MAQPFGNHFWKLVLLAVLLAGLMPVNSESAPRDVAVIPSTGTSGGLVRPIALSTARSPGYRTLSSFVASVRNGNAEQLAGVRARGAFSLPIVQQPSGKPAFVSNNPDVVTEFAMASKYGAIGLMAHNGLAGEVFFQLAKGQQVDLVFGDGSVRRFVVSSMYRYQALSPNSPYSNFVALDDPGTTISAADLFYKVFSSPNRLVFLTCIAKDGLETWGRYFVIAVPAPDMASMVKAQAVQ